MLADASSHATHISQVDALLRNTYPSFIADPEWVAGSVEFYGAEHPPAPLLDWAHDQFLLTDLADSAAPQYAGCLPAEPARMENGQRIAEIPALVQINAIDDITTPALDLRTALDEQGDTVFAKRPALLRLTLSDGVHSCTAAELVSIPALSMRTPLGAKLLIRNALVSEGVLLLTPDNVLAVLGSGVEERENVRRDTFAMIWDARLNRVDGTGGDVDQTNNVPYARPDTEKSGKSPGRTTDPGLVEDEDTVADKDTVANADTVADESPLSHADTVAEESPFSHAKPISRKRERSSSSSILVISDTELAEAIDEDFS